MLNSGVIVVIATLYLGCLFLIAFWTDRAAKLGRGRFVGSPMVYTLSLAVYCTSWTFYGAVGSATRNGLEFLTIYIGPTLVLMGWWFLLRKLVRISEAQRITSIADFISARYGKSASLSALITIIAVIGITPYIALQLKAVAASFDALSGWDPETLTVLPQAAGETVFADTGFWVAACMAAFVILFGTRNLGADERHPGVVAAIAFESIVKLLTLLAIALFAVYGLHGGVRDLFESSQWHEGVQRLSSFDDGFEPRWITTTFLSAAAIICLPRQFQVAVVENANERHLAMASWLFPLYLLAVSLFVIPIAISGMVHLPPSANPDLYVLNVPLVAGYDWLALLAFIGGLSAATSMVIIASIALSIMISNHLVAPILLRFTSVTLHARGDFSKTLLLVRRLSIVAILTLGFTYYYVTTDANPLASIGLISFAGVAQFLPALLGGIYWQGGTKAGAKTGLIVGFALWIYTLLVPSFASAGWAFLDVVSQGPFGIALLKPDALFGFGEWDPLVHGVFWSLSANLFLYVFVSLATRQTPLESLQSALFVNVFQRSGGNVEGALQRSATTDDLLQLTQRIMGRERAYRLFRDYARRQGRPGHLPLPDPGLVMHVERYLASSVGAASASSLVSRIVKGETINLEAVITILDETREAIRYSRELEEKSRELEETAEQLRRANEQLTALDKAKDDFLSHVSHELRTPMTSIRSFSEILSAHGEIDGEQARRFITIIQNESVRLTGLLDEILDLNRMESGQMEWVLEEADVREITRDAVETMQGLGHGEGVRLLDHIGTERLPVMTVPDRLKQVFINLLSNAIKFNDSQDPKVWIETISLPESGRVEIRVRDNGPGIPAEDQPGLFVKFARGWNKNARSRAGTGLGLAISLQIMRQLGGNLELESSSPEEGTCFLVSLPMTPSTSVPHPQNSAVAEDAKDSSEVPKSKASAAE